MYRVIVLSSSKRYARAIDHIAVRVLRGQSALLSRFLCLCAALLIPSGGFIAYLLGCKLFRVSSVTK